MLLKADTDGPRCSDSGIVEAFDFSTETVARLRKPLRKTLKKRTQAVASQALRHPPEVNAELIGQMEETLKVCHRLQIWHAHWFVSTRLANSHSTRCLSRDAARGPIPTENLGS